MYTFQLHRKGVVLVILGAFFLAVLIFAGGYLAGMRRGGSGLAWTAPKIAKPAMPKPAMPKVAVPPVPAPKPAFAGLARNLFGRQTPIATADAIGTAQPQTATIEPDVYILRVGLFTAKDDASALVQQLAARKLTASISTSHTTTGPILYSVHVGRYPTRREAAAALEAMERDLGIDGAVETLQPEPIGLGPPGV
jgi:cell division septation protein DedD